MNATRFYRVAAILFVLFALGHTYGFLTMVPPTAEGRAVLESMNSVHFELRGRSYDYGDFYRGFGLSATVSMLLQAFLAWHLGQLARSVPKAVGAMGWIFCLLQVPGVVMSFLYFGVPPMVLSVLVTVILGAAAWLASVAARASSPASAR